MGKNWDCIRFRVHPKASTSTAVFLSATKNLSRLEILRCAQEDDVGCFRTSIRLVIKKVSCLGFFFTWGLSLSCNTKVIVLDDPTEMSDEEKLTKDVLEILTVFSARLYGKRSHKNRKRAA